MADFKVSVLKTLVNEGGFQNSPKDHANWTSGKIGEGSLVGTKFGITTLDMPGVSIKDISKEDAVKYYSEHFWKSGYSQIDSQILADKIFDLGVLFGVGTVIHILQAVLGLKPDGVFGPVTLQAVNDHDPQDLLQHFKTAMVTRAFQIGEADINKRGNIPGWTRRINS